MKLSTQVQNQLQKARMLGILNTISIPSRKEYYIIEKNQDTLVIIPDTLVIIPDTLVIIPDGVKSIGTLKLGVKHVKLVGGEDLMSTDGMFSYCNTLDTLDISEINMHNVRSMDGMFEQRNAKIKKEV